jgi:hypothetical protein
LPGSSQFFKDQTINFNPTMSFLHICNQSMGWMDGISSMIMELGKSISNKQGELFSSDDL